MDFADREACYRVLETRDARFDGRLFVGVTSTGIYCRPVCPAGPAKRENCRFFPSAAAAQEAGFRPCLRCRPETAPDLASWRGTSNTVSRALALIADGALDGGEAGVDALAARLGIGERQLRRLFTQHLGASPVAVAQTRRILFAKQLIQETQMPMAEVALAAGFGSVRRFNETFHDLFRRPPSTLRRKTTAEPRAGSTGSATDADAGVTLRLRYRPPYDWSAMLAYLDARAIAGVEEVVGDRYRRTVSHDGQLGTVEVSHEPARNNLVVTVRFPSVRALPAILARVRRVFDVGADIEAIGAHLSRDPFLAPLIAQRPGLRAPGGWDGFELALRAILGQQVTVVAARRLAGRLVALCAEPLPEPTPAATAAQVRHATEAVIREGLDTNGVSTNGLSAIGASVNGRRHTPARRGTEGYAPDAHRGPTLTHAFPTPARVAAADLGALGMPSARRAALKALAEAAIADPQLFRPFGTVEEAIARLRSIRGIGEWTAQYIALRALREPDAFPASDIGLLRGAADATGVRPTPADLILRAEPWRPWRAYAAQHLWAADPGSRREMTR